LPGLASPGGPGFDARLRRAGGTAVYAQDMNLGPMLLVVGLLGVVDGGFASGAG
jgi:hypothetical protein